MKLDRKYVTTFDNWLNEGKGDAISKFFSKKTVSRLFSKVDDTSLKYLDDILSGIEKNTLNFKVSEKTGEAFIRSKSGAQLPVKELDDAVTAVLNGKMTADELAKYLPNKVADGTPFRDVITHSLTKRKAISHTDALIKRLPHGKKGAEAARGWQTFGSNPWPQSGWKIHVFGESIEDSVYLYERLKGVVDRWGAHAKVGGTYHATADLFKKGQPQYGKSGATIYIPVDVINSGKQKEFMADIANAISGYNKTGKILGDKQLSGAIHYRYDLKGPIPKSGITDAATMDAMYNKNKGGAHKPVDVEDIF